MNAWIGLLAFLLLGLGVTLATLTLFTLRALTRPPRRTYASALARGRPGDPGELPPGPSGQRAFESWPLRWQRLELPVWDMPGDDPDGPVLVLSHGWGDSRIGALTRAEHLLPLASRLVMWDMPGHGEAPGVCRLGSTEPDALAALLDAVRAARPIVLYGWSLGAGVSIAAASDRRDVAGVIAEAPYRLPATPARNVLAILGLPFRPNLALALGWLNLRAEGRLSPDRFDRAVLASRLACPVLVIHGARDDVCPIADGRAIAGAGRGDMLELASAGHHGLWTSPESLAACRDRVGAFLRRVATIAPRGPAPD